MFEVTLQNVSVGVDATNLTVGGINWNWTTGTAIFTDVGLVDEVTHHQHIHIENVFVQKGDHNALYINIKDVILDSMKTKLEEMVRTLWSGLMDEPLARIGHALTSFLPPPDAPPIIHLQRIEIDADFDLDSNWMPKLKTKVEIPALTTTEGAALAKHALSSMKSEYIRSLILP